MVLCRVAGDHSVVLLLIPPSGSVLQLCHNWEKPDLNPKVMDEVSSQQTLRSVNFRKWQCSSCLSSFCLAVTVDPQLYGLLGEVGITQPSADVLPSATAQVAVVICVRQSRHSCGVDAGVQRQHSMVDGQQELGSGNCPVTISLLLFSALSVTVGCSSLGVDSCKDMDQGRSCSAHQPHGDEGSASGPHCFPGMPDRTLWHC